MHLLRKKLEKLTLIMEKLTLIVPVGGEGSCDACLELCCTKDHFQCLVSMMTLKC